MTRLRLAPAILLLLAACQPHSADPHVEKAWVRLAAVPGQPSAAYFTLEGGDKAESLVKVESALADRAELHQSMTGTQGMMTMKPLENVAVPAGGTVAFKPGGRHVMLYGLDKVVQPGVAVPLRFVFADGKTASTEAKAVSAGADAPY